MIRRVFVALAVGLVALVALPLAAGAHVEIESDGAVGADGTVKATLTVPNECVNASSASLDLNFPATPALTTVTEDAVTGFTTANTTDPTSGKVTKVTITGTLSGEDEQKFPLTLGTIPAGTDEITFTALQHCSDGTVIRWVEPTPPGGAEPEHPAPVLALASSTAETPSTSRVEVTTKNDSSSDSNTTAIVIAVIAGVVVIGGAAFAISRRQR